MVPAGNGVNEGEIYTPGIIALKARTRVASVAVDVGLGLAVGVTVSVGVNVCVAVDVCVGNSVVVGRADGVSEGNTIRVGKSSAALYWNEGTERKATMPHTTTQAIGNIQSIRRRIVTSSSAPPVQSSK